MSKLEAKKSITNSNLIDKKGGLWKKFQFFVLLYFIIFIFNNNLSVNIWRSLVIVKSDMVK